MPTRCSIPRRPPALLAAFPHPDTTSSNSSNTTRAPWATAPSRRSRPPITVGLPRPSAVLSTRDRPHSQPRLAKIRFVHPRMNTALRHELRSAPPSVATTQSLPTTSLRSLLSTSSSPSTAPTRVLAARAGRVAGSQRQTVRPARRLFVSWLIRRPSRPSNRKWPRSCLLTSMSLSRPAEVVVRRLPPLALLLSLPRSPLQLRRLRLLPTPRRARAVAWPPTVPLLRALPPRKAPWARCLGRRRRVSSSLKTTLSTAS